MTITNANLAKRLAAIVKGAADDMALLAEGVWNPGFCSADASITANRIANDLQFAVDRLREHAKQ